ncbi:GIY-YIG nuclease family protein [Riemerella columbina]|uniref:GIY-YIG nuclease family protein n=1 Tax=Riemerella columbina TaxID=103810 RepID=UPI000361E703|nr:GIY-YIG nuclease family protein [Riemerella columbina]
MKSTLFPPQKIPVIYAYRDNRYPSLLKVGYTTLTAKERVEQQYPIQLPSQSWEIVLEEDALREDGSFFTDKAIHKRLKNKHFPNPNGEWFECAVEDIKAALLAERKGIINEEHRTCDFKMRPEQARAVQKTVQYFRSFETEENITPHFLWNAKMRFGKTFAAYQLAKEMGWKKVLILTFKPAVRSAWREDLQSHIDFEGWQFVSQDEQDLNSDAIDPTKPFVYFASFQDVLGKDQKTGGIKIKNRWIHDEDWDCVIFDEYHFGAWRDRSKDLFDKDEEAKNQREQEIAEIKAIEEENNDKAEYIDYFDEKLLPITTKHYLYLSGTPFRAIGTGEFIEEQIFNWTYSDEQKAKQDWDDAKGENPYASLPRMVLLTYKMPEEIEHIARKGEFNEFDLNAFFEAKGEGENAQFKNKDEVQKWIDFIRGQYFVENTLKQGGDKPPMPFSDVNLIHSLQHTFWFLPNVASCFAMANLLKKNTFFNDYKIVVAAGTQAGIGEEALRPVEEAMTKNPFHTKTITLSCGKLTTGVSVKPWTGIFMLRNSSSPETYFQTIFRVQTPWVLKNPDKDAPNREQIIKHECYVFDFAPTRALNQVATYSNQLDPDTAKSPEEKVRDFIHFLPILAYDGSAMEIIDAGKLLDIAHSGTTATLLARRWESALLVNVDNVTLQRLQNNQEAYNALMSIEGFRSLNKGDIETIINKSEAVKKARKEASEEERELTKQEKKVLTDAEKEAKSKRKQIQENLIKFATRIPVFMYLSSYREQTLRDVILYVESDLFKKVTGLSVEDFELLEKIGVFNGALMNDAVFKFKRYEDSSLGYTGLDRYQPERIGGYNTTISQGEFNK